MPVASQHIVVGAQGRGKLQEARGSGREGCGDGEKEERRKDPMSVKGKHSGFLPDSSHLLLALSALPT